MTIRAFYRAVKGETAVSPYDSVTLKIYYPAVLDSESAKNTGVIPADETLAPFPVVIFMPGINVGLEGYHWLAVALAKQGLVVVTYSWIAEEMPGFISLTPGVDLTAVSPQTYGSKPTCPAIQPILDQLQNTQHATRNTTPLAGLLDLDKIILGGHSAGGTMALQNANPDWFPAIKGAFCYAGHTMAATFLGFEAGTILPISSHLPLLILGGSKDGVIEASAHRYKLENPSATLALERTFAEGIDGGQQDKYLVILDGANHFSCVHPIDETTGRPFLDHPTTQEDDRIRNELITLIHFFIDGHIRGSAKSRLALKQQVSSGNPLIAMCKSK
ncbi:alpha/beta hydrolase family protein [Candidatus Leptofilum sp.]|uniref:alpha/beta hydrolase family protein n=1 Tax=Candidatus Leptofilum sp. TaxID=3241576 RepID=UPI003B5C63D9